MTAMETADAPTAGHVKQQPKLTPRARRPLAPCKLCQRTKHLCRSHIVPESCYTKVIDPGLGHALELTRGREEPIRKQTGTWEYLLCEDCEQHLNVLCEQYFEQAWYKIKVLPDRLPLGTTVLRGLDFFKFRLFHLSILWRASVSRKVGMFHEVQLDKNDEELVRQMLWSGYADCMPGYTFTATCLTLEGDVFHAVSDGQRLRRHQGSQRFGWMYAGCIWTFYIGATVPPDVAPWTLQRSGAMQIDVQDVGTYFGARPTWKKRGLSP